MRSLVMACKCYSGSISLILINYNLYQNIMIKRESQFD
jgi:hypothetical protein